MTTTDTPRLVATSSDSDFTLTIDDALALYAESGVPALLAAYKDTVRSNTFRHAASKQNSAKNI